MGRDNKTGAARGGSVSPGCESAVGKNRVSFEEEKGRG